MITRTLLPYLFEAAYMVDEHRRIVYWNQQCERITGYTADEVVGKHCHSNILRHVTDKGVHLCQEGCPLQETLKTGNTNTAKVFLHHRKGHRVPVTVKTIPYLDEESGKCFAIELFTDIEDDASLYRENIELKERVTIDALTGVANKAFIDYQLDTCINEYTVFGTSLGLLFIDIDHFKRVNDTHGHSTGDEVLKMVAKTIALNIRKNDFVGRFGGEEFIVLLRDVSSEQMVLIAEKIRMLIQEARTIIGDTSINVTVSIGCAMLFEGQSKAMLLDESDQNLYAAKSKGRNRIHVSKQPKT